MEVFLQENTLILKAQSDLVSSQIEKLNGCIDTILYNYHEYTEVIIDTSMIDNIDWKGITRLYNFIWH